MPLPESPLTLRVPQQYLDRALDLVPLIAEDPEVAAFTARQVSRSTVLRLAIARGLLLLEGEYRGKSKRKAR